ncbi:hypothetical protein BH11PSE3_BH11PSE3_16390 [soil metagenome]
MSIHGPDASVEANDTADEFGDLHRALASFGRLRLSPATPKSTWREDLRTELGLRSIERGFIEEEWAAVQSLLADMPVGPQHFMAWYEHLASSGPGQGDPLFPWLAEQADLEQMRWFVAQEAAGEAGFDDLVALTQLKLPTAAKLELARNYWDEMGRGHQRAMHGPMLERLVEALELDRQPPAIVWQSLALGNLMTALAINREFAFHSVGALGVIEMTAPDRACAVARGLARLGVDKASRHYFELHAVLDRKHSQQWNGQAILPLVEGDPALARPIAEGALMRLAAGARCFERYRMEFGLPGRSSPGFVTSGDSVGPVDVAYS